MFARHVSKIWEVGLVYYVLYWWLKMKNLTGIYILSRNWITICHVTTFVGEWRLLFLSYLVLHSRQRSTRPTRTDRRDNARRVNAQQSTSLFRAFSRPLFRLGGLSFCSSISSYSFHSRTPPFPFHGIVPPISMTSFYPSRTVHLLCLTLLYFDFISRKNVA